MEEEEELFSDCRSEAGSVVGVEEAGCGPGGRVRGPVCQDRERGGGRGAGRGGLQDWLSVTVAAPHRVGEGISSYLAYHVTTRTNLHCFRRQSCSVTRRYSDFLGLQEKLVGRYQAQGRIIPPAPEKSLLGTTRVKANFIRIEH